MNPSKGKKKRASEYFGKLKQVPISTTTPPPPSKKKRASEYFGKLKQVPISTTTPYIPSKKKRASEYFGKIKQVPVPGLKPVSQAEPKKETEKDFSAAMKATGKWKALLGPFFEEMKAQGVGLSKRLVRLKQLSEERCLIGRTPYTCYSVIADEVWRGEPVSEEIASVGRLTEEEEPDIRYKYAIGERKRVLKVEYDFYNFLKNNFELLRKFKEGKLLKPKVTPKKKKPVTVTPGIEEKAEKRAERKAKLALLMEDYLDYLIAVKGTPDAHRGEFLEFWREKMERREELPFNYGKLSPEIFYEQWVTRFSEATDPTKTYLIEYIESDAGWLDPDVSIDPMVMATYNAASPLRQKGIIGYVDQRGNPIDPENPPKEGIWGRRASLPMVLYFNWLVDYGWGTNYTVQQYNERRVKEANEDRIYQIELKPFQPEKESIVSTYRARYRNRKKNKQVPSLEQIERRIKSARYGY